MEWEFHTPAMQTFDINLDGAIAASRDAGAESLMFYIQDHWVTPSIPAIPRFAIPI